jgi:hypothetical protein
MRLWTAGLVPICLAVAVHAIYAVGVARGGAHGPPAVRRGTGGGHAEGTLGNVTADGDPAPSVLGPLGGGEAEGQALLGAVATTEGPAVAASVAPELTAVPEAPTDSSAAATGQPGPAPPTLEPASAEEPGGSEGPTPAAESGDAEDGAPQESPPGNQAPADSAHVEPPMSETVEGVDTRRGALDVGGVTGDDVGATSGQAHGEENASAKSSDGAEGRTTPGGPDSPRADAPSGAPLGLIAGSCVAALVAVAILGALAVSHKGMRGVGSSGRPPPPAPASSSPSAAAETTCRADPASPGLDASASNPSACLDLEANKAGKGALELPPPSPQVPCPGSTTPTGRQAGPSVQPGPPAQPRTMNWAVDWAVGKEPVSSYSTSSNAIPWSCKRSAPWACKTGSTNAPTSRRRGQQIASRAAAAGRLLTPSGRVPAASTTDAADPARDQPSEAHIRMKDTLRQVTPNATHVRAPCTAPVGVHMAVVLDASTGSFSKAQYDEIKSLIFNGSTGLFDRLAAEVTGHVHCSFIQYARTSSAIQPTAYGSKSELGAALAGQELACGQRGSEDHGEAREIHLGLNRCFNQLQRRGSGPAPAEMRRVVVLCGGPITENGVPSDGFAAWETARALHGDGVPVVAIDFRPGPADPIRIASGAPPLYFRIDGVPEFATVLGPLTKLLASVHLTPLREASLESVDRARL